MDFKDYDPKNFAAAYGRWQRQLTAFFSQPTILTRLETSVELDRPAAQAIAKPFLAAFGDDAMDLRLRQLVGHMIRYVMEDLLGYELDQEEVRIPGGKPFTRAARYREKASKKPKKP